MVDAACYDPEGVVSLTGMVQALGADGASARFWVCLGSCANGRENATATKRSSSVLV